ncbi:allatostatin-A receptor-like [Ostrea edulis]|uniref:allatostatin-A receptor-like n=1 Tax=Ostrea edulis TaxID=37623 RepID=UPI0024AF955A|nr:allatostatin-A receptor-like [Ostrea edulis]
MQNVSCNNETISEDPGYVDIEKFLKFENLVRYLIPITFALIAVLGIVGNALVIHVFVILSKKKSQNTTNILIVSLAAADLLFLVFCVPFTAANYAMSYWPFGNVWCKIVNFMTHVCAYVSIWTLVLLSLDRCIAVVHPVLSKQIRNCRNTCLLLGITWTLILCGNVPILLQYGVLHYQWMGFDRSSCLNLAGLRSKIVLKVFYGCFFVFGYVLPLTLICVLYGFILKKMLHRSTATTHQRRSTRHRKRRVIRVVVAFVVAFAICWLPIQVMCIVGSFTHYERTMGSTAVLMVANCMSYINSCINPVLYAFLSKDFQRRFLFIRK